jgi:hypothetical protein
MADYDQQSAQGNDPLQPLPQSVSPTEGHPEGGEHDEAGWLPAFLSTWGDTFEKFAKTTRAEQLEPCGPALGLASGAMEVDEGGKEIQEGHDNPDSGTGAAQQIHGGLKGGAGLTEIIGSGAALVGLESLAPLGPLGFAAGAGLAVGDAIAPTLIDPFFEGPSYVETLDTQRAKQATADQEHQQQLQVSRDRNCDSGITSIDAECQQEQQAYKNGAQSMDPKANAQDAPQQSVAVPDDRTFEQKWMAPKGDWVQTTE